MGVPVVTLVGNRCSQRFGYSLLSRLELVDLIAHSEDEYILKAKDLALDIDKRQSLRCQLRSKMEERICNASVFVRELEVMYQNMIDEI